MGNLIPLSRPKAVKKVRFNLAIESTIENHELVIDKIFDITERNVQINVYKRSISLKRKYEDEPLNENLLSRFSSEPIAKRMSLDMFKTGQLKEDEKILDDSRNKYCNIQGEENENVDINNNINNNRNTLTNSEKSMIFKFI